MDEEDFRSFYITYKDGLFQAYSYNADRGIYTRKEVDFGLEKLLLKCKDAGFNHLDGLTNEAIDAVHEISERSIRANSVLDYVEGLWQGEHSVRRIGFRREEPVRMDAKTAETDLERYGIKPTPPSDYVVTNEMVNKMRDELGI